MRRTAKGKRIRPCKEATIQTRRSVLRAAAKMAVRQGVPIESLTSLSGLLDPKVVEKVLDGYWRQDGETPRVFTIDLSWRFLSVARETKCLDEEGCERLDEMRAEMETYRQGGPTEKNLNLIRQVLDDRTWDKVINLPRRLMALAQQDHAPLKAALTAQIAVAVGILTVAPIRLGNLIAIRLEENLRKPAGPDSPYWLTFPDYDVKNRVKLEYPLDERLTDLIDEYIHEFRPTLLRGSNERWLFPGEGQGHKDKKAFSKQITERIEKSTGLRMTVHQFRHAAGAVFLKHRPGNYEVVRRLLGHRNIQTTMHFYCGLETTQASEMYGRIIRERVSLESEPV